MSWIKRLFSFQEPLSPPPEGELPSVLPVLPLKDAVLLPDAILPLLVTNESSVQRVRELHESGELILAVGMEKSLDIEQATWDHLFRTGCIARITKISETEGNDVSIMVRGVRKVRLEEQISDEPDMRVRVSTRGEDLEVTRTVQALALATRELLGQLARLSYHNLEAILTNLAKIREPYIFLCTCTTTLPIGTSKKQHILELDNLEDKFDFLHRTLREEMEILELSTRITERARGEINSAQREYYLRQQLKAIRKELGEGGDPESEVEEVEEELEARGLPEAVKKEVDRDLKRMSRMQPGSAEYVTVRTYLDWILDLPWQEKSEDNQDIQRVQEILDEDHFNLKRPKKRIIEFLSVKKLKGELKGPILCFVGPPGVGKTSLGKSIARAMNREFVRISLGGVRDEAEIRGHRRTYIGALPGRIINGLKQAGTINPVFMLDEIDKLTHDIHGDPASALLEALDPEQNASFVDHYLNVPYDLSQVLFITTANVIDNIPPALKDRMEVVEIEGYTQEDKLQIARDYLINKELDANGLVGYGIEFEDAAVAKIIRSYTRESGVRSLQREIASVLRVIASNVAREEKSDFHVDQEFVEQSLGPVRFLPETSGRIRIPGIATGLAWTPYGGEILFIEAAFVEGKEEMILTGQLGDVMKESARIALSLVKSSAPGIPGQRGVHIHVPSGAIPKDGPSAGVTMVTALMSLLSGRPVRDDLAMTGEITLRGVVLPVGGIKEKILAARRAGIHEIVLPRLNEKDLSDIEGKLLVDLNIHLVDTIDEVLALAFPDDHDAVALLPAGEVLRLHGETGVPVPPSRL